VPPAHFINALSNPFSKVLYPKSKRQYHKILPFLELITAFLLFSPPALFVAACVNFLCSSTQRAKNVPPAHFINALSNPFSKVLRPKSKRQYHKILPFFGADNGI
jgi:uncharacterized protein YggT (Ycf19 family)